MLPIFFQPDSGRQFSHYPCPCPGAQSRTAAEACFRAGVGGEPELGGELCTCLGSTMASLWLASPAAFPCWPGSLLEPVLGAAWSSPVFSGKPLPLIALWPNPRCPQVTLSFCLWRLGLGILTLALRSAC